MTGTLVIVPYREPGKTRLAASSDGPGLDARWRTALARAMLTDVVRAIRDAAIGELVVAAGDPHAARLAERLGVRSVRDPVDAGLNGAVDVAATSRPAPAVLVVAADLPTLGTRDIRAIVEADAEVVVAPTNRGGTGGLLRRPVTAIPASYGPGSARRHVDTAERADRSAVLLDLPGFRDDVDTIDDLTALPADRLGAATLEVVTTLAVR